MTEAVQPAESGPLSVDQAVESLIAPQSEQHEEAAPVEAAAEEIEADPNPAEDASEAEEPGDGGETEEPAEAAAEPVNAPQWWDAEAKAHFAALTPDLQAIVLAQEDKREAITAKAKQEAAEERKAAQAESAGVRKLAEQLATFLPEAVETFKQKWGEPDWVATVEQYGAEETMKLKAQYDADQAKLAKIAEANRAAQAEARQASLREENEKLKGTPLEAMPARQEVAKYLGESGYSSDELSNATARDLLVAHKAMLYDKAQAALKAKPPKPVTPVPVAAAARPAAAQPGSSQTRSSQQAANRFAQTRSVDDAVALLLAKGS